MKAITIITAILFLSLFTKSGPAFGQAGVIRSIKGHLQEEQSLEPVAFATVAVRTQQDSTFITGTASDIDGNFIISIAGGNYELQITAIGYGKATRAIELTDDIDLGNILLQEKLAVLEEIVILGERIKAQKEADKTTWFVNGNLHEIANTGSEILGYIPGIQVDLMKNISLNGNQNVLILVDGRESDKNYLSQLEPEKIDRVEVSESAGARYDATISGVINIILKEESGSGISGHVYGEIPASGKVSYAFPAYSLNYRIKKLDLFTSYNGEFSFFDITESEIRNFDTGVGSVNNITTQYVRQKDWSSRFHYGAGYDFGKKDYLNFYGFFNPYSHEFDGKVDFSSVSERGVNELSYLKDDTDRNRSTFYSLYYRHGFDKPGSEISLDMNYNRFSAENSTAYLNPELPHDIHTNRINSVRPFQNSYNLRIDFSSPLSDRLVFNTGFKARLQSLSDRNSDSFSYDEKVYAAYGNFTLTLNEYIFKAGLRTEKVISKLAGSAERHKLNFLPQVSVIRKLSDKRSLELSYGATIYRPNIYELNPYTSINDPFSLSSGNPFLGSETRSDLKLEYSKTSGDYFYSAGLISKVRRNAVNQYVFINEDGLLESRIANLGTILENGIQFTGSLKFSKSISFNSYLKLYGLSTSGNYPAAAFNIRNRNKAAFESSLSAIANLKHDIAISFQFQYNSPRIDIQKTSFSDPLWFLSAEKTIKKNLKLGITSALPLTRTFTYRGWRINQENLYCHSEGKLNLPLFPVWFKIRYQFSSGAKTGKISASAEDFINIPKKGF